MPNWVRNNVYLYGETNKLNELKQFVSSEKNVFDFKKIVPMPESLEIQAGSSEDFAISCAKRNRLGLTIDISQAEWMKEHSAEEWISLGEKYLRNKELYGFTTWYGWCSANWGTKWNSCDAAWDGIDFVSFDTAWNMPDPIFTTLANLFQGITIEVEFADEDYGHNCGRAYYNDGKIGCNSVILESNPEFAENVWNAKYDKALTTERKW